MVRLDASFIQSTIARTLLAAAQRHPPLVTGSQLQPTCSPVCQLQPTVSQLQPTCGPVCKLQPKVSDTIYL